MTRKKRRTGRLRHVCVVEKDTSDESAVTPTWGNFKRRVPCNVQDLEGDESTARSRQAEATVTSLVTMRHLPGLRPTMRLLFLNRSPVRTLYIRRILRDGYGHDMTVECGENPDAR